MAIDNSAEQGNGAPDLLATRLCIKNIPKYINEARLKEHFASQGEVTDVKVLRTKDGISRQMAFIGYRSEEDAAKALKYYNKSYLDTSRLAVEYARKYKDSALPRPWSKYSQGSSKHHTLTEQQAAAAAVAAGLDPAAATAAAKAAAKGSRKGSSSDPAELDPKLAEFLELMKPRVRASVWSNDDALLAAAAAAGSKEALAAHKQQQKLAAGAGAGAGAGKGGWRGQPPAAAAAGEGEDAETEEAVFEGDDDSEGDGSESEDAFEVPAAGRRQQKQAAGGSSSSLDDSSEEEGEEEEEEGAAAAVGKDAAVVDEGVSDLDYLRSRMKPAALLDEDEEEEQQRQRLGKSAGAAGDSDEEEEELGSDNGEDSGGPSSSRDERAAAEEQRAGSEGPSGDGDEGEQYNAAVRGDQAGVGPSMHPDRAAAVAAAEEAGPAGDGHALVLDTGRLFVRNLAYSVMEADLSAAFGAFGDLEEVHLVLDRETKRPIGTAYVKFQVPEDALKALRELDMTPLQGRLLHVLPAQPSRAAAAAAAAAEAAREEQQGAKQGGFKSQREQQRRGDAGNRAAWNSLFLRQDTVAEAVAAHYGISKAQLLDAEAADLPVRMALGEVQIISQTKEALAEAGVKVSALEAAAAAAGRGAAAKAIARSANTLLVKNLPYSASEEELAEVFGRCGEVVRLVLPPARVVALVEYGEAQDARSAFRALAYKKYQHVPLYLEWAPKDIWEGDPAAAAAAKQKTLTSKSAGATGATGSSSSKAAAAAEELGAEDAGEGEGEAALNSCIYVKNLSFATTDAAFRKHFDKVVSAAGGTIHSAKVARKPAADGKLLSMGFGFVECDSEAAAKAAIRQLQGTLLDKYKLQLQLAKRRPAASSSKDAAKKKKDKDVGTKLVVRNVAFEATRKDLVGLFGPFGHLKTCRLPKKFDGSHRGFAFVEFVTKQEAANALEGVGGTHLYGRRLVVEYAAAGEEEGLTELRAKAAARLRAEEEEVGVQQAAKRMKKTL